METFTRLYTLDSEIMRSRAANPFSS